MSSDFYSVAAAASSGVASANCSSSRWLTEEVFKLIEMVQRDEAIYNPRHKYYFCRPYVENFWREVDLKLEKNPGASLAKWTNLRISFRREYTNYLEEKVPPCWSYFDRMFFLHPFLRKKHQQPKSLDSQVQDALVQINSLSNRLQRERAVAAAASVSASLGSTNGRETQAQQQQPLDNYLDYFDDPDPEQNNSELDEIIEEEQNLETHSLNNDIKSECEETAEEDYEPEIIRHDDEADDADMRNFILDSLASTTSGASQQQHERRHQRMQHLNRLQMRSYHEELRSGKRPRSQESIGSSQSTTQRLLSTSTPAHSNVSFVRPTFAKPMELVSTTTGITTTNPDADLVSSSPAAALQPSITTTSVQPLALSHAQPRHLPHHHHHHRLEIPSIGSSSNSLAAAATTASAPQPPPSSNHVELCDCKTDPDAMFLMSLLPDIQKLNGRDRGKIKIAFQNILQDYLYPD